MRKATIIQNVRFEGPARVKERLEHRGYQLEILHAYAGATVPRSLPPHELLVIMGGPMGVADIDSNHYPFLAAEAALLRTRIEADAPTLGVCLGAQLMAFAAGSRVYENRVASPAPGQGALVREVGWADVQFLGETRDSSLRGLPTTAPMFHWHGDTFDVPRGATLLASTERCKAQAFRLKQRLFGLQFHCELERADIERLLTKDEAYAKLALGADANDIVRRDTARFFEPARAVGTLLLDNILSSMA